MNLVNVMNHVIYYLHLYQLPSYYIFVLESNKQSKCQQNFHNQTKLVLKDQITLFVTLKFHIYSSGSKEGFPLRKKQISKTSSLSTEAMQKSFQTCFWNIAQILKSHVAKTCQVFTYMFLQRTKSLTHEDSNCTHTQF